MAMQQTAQVIIHFNYPLLEVESESNLNAET